MSKELKDIINQSYDYLKNVDNIGISNDFKDFYYLIDYVVFNVKKTYPIFLCKPGCSECCYDLYPVNAVEWELIHKFILQNLVDTVRNKIIENTEFYRKFFNIFVNNLITGSKIKPNIPKNPCPFLFNDLCIIYPVRPSICRIHGYFALIKDNNYFISSCSKIAKTFNKNNINDLILPLWVHYRDKLNELNKGNFVSAMPFWLITHIENNNFKDKTSLKLESVLHKYLKRSGFLLSQE